MSKSKQELEKAQIILQESKARLTSSKNSSEQLENKISHFSNLCIASIGGLITAISFVKGLVFFKISLFILTIGFIHSLINLLKLKKTNKFASDGLEASTIIDSNSNDNASLLRRLALTYEDKASHNYKLTEKIANNFDKVLLNIEKYVVFSALVLLLGFIL